MSNNSFNDFDLTEHQKERDRNTDTETQNDRNKQQTHKIVLNKSSNYSSLWRSNYF